MKAHIKSFGCQMNEQDALHMRGLLSKLGYESAEEASQSDLVLLVTCSIRDKAEQKVYSELGRLRPLVEENPALLVGVAGCVAQQEKGRIQKRFPFVDMVFGPDAIAQLPAMVTQARSAKALGERPGIVQTSFHSRRDFEFINLLAGRDETAVTAFVNIQKGCDNICSFCIVPHVRGREVSRPSADIIREVRELVALGVKDVTLLGQNVNSYGLKTPGDDSFAELLRAIAGETDLKRLRFTTSHPKDVGDDLVSAFRDVKILCPHFHLPVQSGSNRILKDMRRQYTREEYLEKIAKLRDARPSLSFTTDMIVGFPGEEEDDFNQTLSLVTEVGFDMIYTFAYSSRPGTSAARLVDKLSAAEKSARLEKLNEIQNEIAWAKNRAIEGSIEEVLVESMTHAGQNGTGRTGSNKVVHFTRPDLEGKPGNDLTGEFITVRITKGQGYSLIGEAEPNYRSRNLIDVPEREQQTRT